jgi:hypothetical protein
MLGLLVGAAGPAAASHSRDLDCSDFRYYEDALAHLRAHPGDPDRLDADGDGRPCETLPRRGTPTVAPAPTPAPAPPPCVYGAIGARYASLGGAAGFLRNVVTCERSTPAKPGRFNVFQGGSIYWSPSTGAWELHGEIRNRWGALGWENSALGFPVTNENRTPRRLGAYNHFQTGSIYWSPSTGAREVRGAIRTTWSRLGWENSVLGFPTTDERRTPGRPGAFNHFQSGSVYWSPSTGAHAVYGAIRERWARLGWENSALGFPTTSEYAISGGRRSDFQGGSITWTPARGAVVQLAPPVALPAPLPPVGGSSTAAGLLSQLTVVPENTSTYDRDLFEHWIDADGDGCDTRREVLLQESLTQTTVGDGCAISGGSWLSYYDGITTDDPTELQVDHVVALSEAWDSGAHQWTADRRRAFANDLDYAGTLQAVTGESNQAKRDYDPAQWLPPLAASECTYATTWVAVKWRWRLTIDLAEKNRLAQLLSGACGSRDMGVSRAG